MSDISISALPAVGMIAVRGELDVVNTAVTAVTGCDAPAQRMSTRAADVTSMWMSPDELLLVCDYGSAKGIAARLGAELADVFATITIVSDARQVFDIRGDDSEEVLRKLMPVDFAKLAPTEVRRTRMAQIPAAIWRHSNGFHLICFRSVGDYAEELLRNARPSGG